MTEFAINRRTQPKIYINIGCLMDIPSGSLIIGRKGETIINGGLGNITGIVGGGNNYKSTIIHYMMLSAADKILKSNETRLTTYDTEVNISLDRLEDLANKFESIPNNPILSDNPIWTVTDKSQIDGAEWSTMINNYIDEKIKDKSNLITLSCFKDPYSDKSLTTLIPTFIEIDSFTEFEGSNTVDLLSKNLESSDTNTFAMKQGLFKTKFFTNLPRLSQSSNTYFLLTAHIGEKININQGMPFANQNNKKLQYLKSDDSIKGTSGKFNFLTNTAWRAHTASVLKNSSTGKSEYPLNSDERVESDLNIVRLTYLRNKNGISGNTISVIISQTEGVLPSLSEFHFIKENNRFGIDGNNINYHLDLYPECSINRVSIRKKLSSDNKLRRAVNITSELLQLEYFMSSKLKEYDLLCSPKELYNDIKKMGYDWNKLLETRGYWLIDQYTNKVPFLSTIDLLKIRKGLYKPYFYK